MANFTERIKIIVDVVSEGASTGFSNLKSSVSEAEGTLGKFKAGASSVFDTVKANAGIFAVGAGAAIVGFGVKAVGAFTDTAKAAIDLSTATGLSIEQASRWIAVGDDFEVGADALATGLGKISKTLDDTKWAKYGIDTHDASGKARAANDILLDTFDMLSKISNETERASVGQELFGKGYQSLTPILGHTREEYEKMLGSVEKGQVITEEEAEKAEKFRLAQDQLGDALQDVTLAVGEQVAGLSPLLVSLAKLVGLLAQLPTNMLHFGGAGEVIDTLYALRTEAEKGGKSWEEWRKDVLNGKVTLDEAVTAIHAAADANADVNSTLDGGERSWENTTDAVKDLTAAQAEAKRKADAFSTALQTQIDKLADLYPKEFDAVNAKYDYADAQHEATLKTDAFNTTLADEKSTQEDVYNAQKNATDAIIAQSEQYATLNGAALGSEGATRRQIESLEAQAATLAPGSPLRLFLDQYIADLKGIPSTISTEMNLHISQGSAYTKDGDVIGVFAKPGTIKRFATGGIVPGAIGEPVPAIVHGGEEVIPVGGRGHGDTYIYNMVLPPGLSPTDVASASRRYNRRGGR